MDYLLSCDSFRQFSTHIHAWLALETRLCFYIFFVLFLVLNPNIYRYLFLRYFSLSSSVRIVGRLTTKKNEMLDLFFLRSCVENIRSYNALFDTFIYSFSIVRLIFVVGHLTKRAFCFCIFHFGKCHRIYLYFSS